MTTLVAPPARWTFDAIGTRWNVDTTHQLDAATRAEVDRTIAGFDRDWSRFRDDSVVSGLGRAGGEVPAPPDAAAMLELYDEVDAATDGAVNPLVGDTLARLGYGPPAASAEPSRSGVATAQSEREKPCASDTGAARGWRDTVRWDAGMLSLSAPATLDVGALGKGRLVDLVLDVVQRAAPGDVVVDASGDLAARGRTQRVALEHPFHLDRAIGVWAVKDAALCASATNRRAWGDGLHHVLDARTGIPVRAYAATWAVTDTAMRADALATALFFDGGPELAHRWNAQWVRMRTDGRVEWSPGCTAELFA